MLTVIVTWRDRSELRQALPSWLEAANACNGNVLIVNAGGDSCDLQKQLGSANGSVVVAHIPPTNYFNKPVAQNIGASCSDTPFLFFCDCDIILTPTALQALLCQVSSDAQSFGTLAGVQESVINSRGGNHIACFGYTLRLRTVDGAAVTITDHEEDATTGTRHAPGLLLVRRSHFEEVGGYSSDLDGWGWEDQDMICRLTLGAKLRRVSYGTVVHLSHSDESRVAAYPIADRWESRDRMFRRALARYDRGYFLGTYGQDTANSGVWVSRPGATTNF